VLGIPIGTAKSRLHRLVAEGLSNRAIAERLVLGVRTVETHMTTIFGKLGLEETPDQHRRVLAVLTLLRA